MNQLGGLAEDYTKYQEKGAQVIALAVQPQEEAALTVERTKAPYPVLADSDHVVTEEFGIFNLFAGFEAAPSVFIIDQDGLITWAHIASTVSERVPSETILENLQ
jgi:peroxiredoxin Q/BCP